MSAISLDEVSVSFGRGAGRVEVLDRVSLDVHQGQIHALVGESGCGKTTTGRLIAGLLQPSSGRMLLEGRDLSSMTARERRKHRLGVQFIHQDPYASLNPSHTVFEQLAAPLRRHQRLKGTALRRRCLELLEIVALSPASEVLAKFPHQLSGGQRQRLSIARILTVNPSIIVADEAVSMVDVSLRVAILDVLRELRRDMNVGILFITHDLAAARYVSDGGDLSVMYLGRVVETGPVATVIDNPQHPYTRALIDAVPADPRQPAPLPLEVHRDLGEVPSLLRVPSGCAFHPRCPIALTGTCEEVSPQLRTVGTGGVRVSCHLIGGGDQRPVVGAENIAT